MSVISCKKTRRQFLVGAGNSMLALPFLPSLFSQSAEAQSVTMQKRMMTFWFDHNTMREYWPDRAIATIPVGTSGARETLLRNLPNADAFSPLMNHQVLDGLRRADQITLVRGFEVLGGGGHGLWPLGGNVMDGFAQGPENFPTFDTLMEASRTLYPATTPAEIKKVIRVTLQNGPSWYQQRTGNTVQMLPAYGNEDFDYDRQRYTSASLPRMYNDIFGALTGGTVPIQDLTNQFKTNILNRVHASFMSFRANRKVASDDIARVDQHLGFLSDLQRRYSAAASTNMCVRPPVPLGTITDPVVFVPIYLSLLSAAFKCNLTKVGMLYFDSHNPRWLPGLQLGGAGDFHAGMHGEAGATVRNNAYRIYNKWGMDQIAQYFLTPLNEQEGSTGRTYIDNMATVILSQAGYESANGGSSHTSFDMHQIILGSMGGAIRAGRYVAFPENNGRLMPYNSFLITLFRLMGVPESEYSIYATGGRGFGKYTAATGNAYDARRYTPVTEILT